MILKNAKRGGYGKLLLLLVCLSVGISNAVESPLSSAETTKHGAEGPFKELPPEVVAHINTFLSSSQSAEEALKNIQSFARTQKSLYAILTDLQVTNEIITLVSKRFDKHPLDIAVLLRTPTALEWLKSYLKENSQEIQWAKDALVQAARDGNLSIVGFLVKAGIELNHGYKDDVTPLHGAASEDEDETANLLIREGADVNVQDNIGFTPLHYAALGRDKVASTLIKAGANINKTDSEGSTPLNVAVSFGRIKIIGMLIKAGAAIHIADNDGKTPLMTAVEKGRTKIVALLLKHGADIHRKDNSGKTALDLAQNKPAILKLIQKVS